MIIWSVKVKKKPLFWTMAAVLAGITILIVVLTRWNDVQSVGARPSPAAGTEAQRRDYLASFGWELAAESTATFGSRKPTRSQLIPTAFTSTPCAFQTSFGEQSLKQRS